jgi:hypothetical protein
MGVESIQIRLLDALGPLAALHALCHKAMSEKESVDPRQALEAVNTSLAFVGNANAQACYERRRLILRKVNPELVTYATKGGLSTSSTDLFGEGLRKAIKETMKLNKEVAGFARVNSPIG